MFWVHCFTYLRILGVLASGPAHTIGLKFLQSRIFKFSFTYNFMRHFLKIPTIVPTFKVEKIWKGSLDLIPSPSPSVKIQIMGGKVSLRCKGKTGGCQQTFENKKFVDITQQCFALLPQGNFPAHNLNFHWRWRWWNQIQAIFLNIFYFTGWLHLFILRSFKSGSCILWIKDS